MTSTNTSTKNCISLKGSAKLVSEFFYYGINSILYQRGIYPTENFTQKEQYGLKMFVTDDKAVNSYLKEILAQIKNWLEQGQIQRLVLVINSVATKEVLERWDFQIDNTQALKDAKDANSGTPVDPNAPIGVKELKTIQKEMREVFRQITASVSFLPLLDHQCAFDLLVPTNKDCKIPEVWEDSAPCFINDCQEVRLKSFSTSVHKVQAAVAFKKIDEY